jgi:hypothetical protein
VVPIKTHFLPVRCTAVNEGQTGMNFGGAPHVFEIKIGRQPCLHFKQEHDLRAPTNAVHAIHAMLSRLFILSFITTHRQRATMSSKSTPTSTTTTTAQLQADVATVSTYLQLSGLFHLCLM